MVACHTQCNHSSPCLLSLTPPPHLVAPSLLRLYVLTPLHQQRTWCDFACFTATPLPQAVNGSVSHSERSLVTTSVQPHTPFTAGRTSISETTCSYPPSCPAHSVRFLLFYIYSLTSSCKQQPVALGAITRHQVCSTPYPLHSWSHHFV